MEPLYGLLDCTKASHAIRDEYGLDPAVGIAIAKILNQWREKYEAARSMTGQWTPAPDGVVFHQLEKVYEEGFYAGYSESIAFASVRDKGQAIAIGSMPVEDEHEIYLPDDIRLCLRVAPASLSPCPFCDGTGIRTEWADTVDGTGEYASYICRDCDGSGKQGQPTLPDDLRLCRHAPAGEGYEIRLNLQGEKV